MLREHNNPCKLELELIGELQEALGLITNTTRASKCSFLKSPSLFFFFCTMTPSERLLLTLSSSYIVFVICKPIKHLQFTSVQGISDVMSLGPDAALQLACATFLVRVQIGQRWLSAAC